MRYRRQMTFVCPAITLYSTSSATARVVSRNLNQACHTVSYQSNRTIQDALCTWKALSTGKHRSVPRNIDRKDKRKVNHTCLSILVNMASGNKPQERLQSIKDHLEPAIQDHDVRLHLEPESTYPYPTDFKIREHPVDHHRELKVAVIGGGLSGITAGILLPKKVPNINLTIIEKNSELGGTWLENSYPGVRCDVPAHVYQSTFEPNTQWSEVFAQGPEILSYWQSVAKKHDIYSKTRFGSRVTGAYWDEAKSQWRVNISDTKTLQQTDEYYDFVIPAIGHFNEWKLPDYPGISTFKGHLRHSSNWDTTFDPIEKRVAVIGNGASGVQVVPNLQPKVKHLDHYARSPTWIAGAFAGTLERQLEPTPYSAEQLESFQDPAKYHEFRKKLESTFWRRYETQLKGTKESAQVITDFRNLMAKRLEAKPELLEQIVPDFSPHCRRLTPGPGYLEALTKDNVSFIRTPIEKITEDGIVTTDGIHRPVDAIICSTGANVDFAPPFPIVAGDVDLSQAWRPEGLYGFPYTYLGVATPGFSNLLFLHGKFSFKAIPSGQIPNLLQDRMHRELREHLHMLVSSYAISPSRSVPILTIAAQPKHKWPL